MSLNPYFNIEDENEKLDFSTISKGKHYNKKETYNKKEIFLKE